MAGSWILILQWARSWILDVSDSGSGALGLARHVAAWRADWPAVLRRIDAQRRRERAVRRRRRKKAAEAAAAEAARQTRAAVFVAELAAGRAQCTATAAARAYPPQRKRPPSQLPSPDPSKPTHAPPSRGHPLQHSRVKCGSPRLHLGPYKRQEFRDRSGFSADFYLKPHRHGTIYQTVKMQYQLDGETTTYAYTEAWTTKQRGLDQGGTDSFLIPDSARSDGPSSTYL